MEFQPYIFETSFETDTDTMIKLDTDEYLFKPTINPHKYINIYYDYEVFQVIVKSLTGKELKIDVYPYTTVKELKMAIQKADDVICNQQRIIFKGKELHDGYTMKFYNINSGDLLHLILSLRGGMFHETSSRKDHEFLGCKPKNMLEVKMLEEFELEFELENEIALLEKKLNKMKKIK